MGCAVSTALTCLLCSNQCSIEKVASNFAFFPPKPPSYSLEQDSTGKWRFVFASPEMLEAVDSVAHLTRAVQVNVHYIETSRKQRIAAVHFAYPGVEVRESLAKPTQSPRTPTLGPPPSDPHPRTPILGPPSSDPHLPSPTLHRPPSIAHPPSTP